MTDAPPLWFVYDSEGRFMPASGHTKSVADKHYVGGTTYRLAPYHGRSMASHAHQFAALHDAWANLPPDMMLLYPSAEHLRKWCLIKSGWCNSQTFVMSDHGQAKKLARELKSHDEFSVVSIKDAIVIMTTAKSQSKKAMGGDDFNRSKSDCLAVVAELLGTTVKELEANTGKSGDGTR